VSRLAEAILELDEQIRYVATYVDGRLELRERAGLTGASAPESDKYEELLVNPTLLTLLAQRGNIDCGGLSYVLIRYGNFFQLVTRVPGGHVSVALEPTADLNLVERVLRLAEQETA
jgi:hypothetical protein